MPILREDRALKEALTACRNICVVGISPDPCKPSYFVFDALQSSGFKLSLVDPNYAGRSIPGEKVYASLQEVPDEIDIIDVFRRPSAAASLASPGTAGASAITGYITDPREV